MVTITAGPRTLRRTPEQWDDPGYERIGIRPLAPTIGAEITGVDLSQVDAAVFAEIHRALLEWKVIFFRDQRLTPAQHVEFACRWGDLEQHPFLASGSTDDVVRFEKGERSSGYENQWHTDTTWRDRPAMAAILRCIEVPEVGGDTLFADMAAAYDNLSEAMRARIDTMTAVHDFVPTFGVILDPERRSEMEERFPPVQHPIVRTHPETGRKTLFVNGLFTTRILGLDEAESDALLDRLYRQAQFPEYQCRWAWRPGDVGMWDNRAVQHYACSDYWPARRVMERVAVVGDRPV